ncbi:UPF0738 family protein [Bacillus fonticola]|uniref:UPF0738 family protein n=1 Tax=Bacillus fonticola TaxID=2728853 RepID=UPI001473BBF6|nr:hypothetical protein [Bacillus fonticola]
MRTFYTVERTTYEGDRLVAHLANGQLLQGLADADQLLAHSDDLSFLSILENDEGYTYILWPQPIWVDLKKGWDERKEVVMCDGASTVSLPHFWVNLENLIGNIEGNANYGDEMVAAVEEAFFASAK